MAACSLSKLVRENTGQYKSYCRSLDISLWTIEKSRWQEIRTLKIRSTRKRFNTVKIKPWRSEQPGQIQQREDPTLEIRTTRDRFNSVKIQPWRSEQPGQIQQREDPTLEIRTTRTDSTAWRSNPGDQNNQDRFNSVKNKPWRSEQPETDSTLWRSNPGDQNNQGQIQQRED